LLSVVVDDLLQAAFFVASVVSFDLGQQDAFFSMLPLFLFVVSQHDFWVAGLVSLVAFVLVTSLMVTMVTAAATIAININFIHELLFLGVQQSVLPHPQSDFDLFSFSIL